MPVVSLPEDLSEQLKKSESAMINDTEGPGVARYSTPDGRTRADVYVGLELDGLNKYQNISSVDPSIKMKFAVQPDVLCQTDVLEFTPNYDSVIGIQVVVSWTLLCLVIPGLYGSSSISNSRQ